jgi:hypothetical protein
MICDSGIGKSAMSLPSGEDSVDYRRFEIPE